MKRLFIGIPIRSTNVSETIGTWKNDEKLQHNVLKWVNSENWHITLIFLGDTPESEVEKLKLMIEESFKHIPAFSAALSGVGVFPNSHNPKVLWIGFDSLQPLMPAQYRLVELLQFHGFSLDNKPLKPHLTLARIRNPEHVVSFESLLEKYQSYSFGTVKIKQVVLYESILTSNGPVYTPLFVAELSD
jgi:2'-5' RNA ligase